MSQPVPLSGSEDTLRPGERVVGNAAPDQQITVTVLLRRPAQAPSEQDLLSGNYQASSRQQAEESLRADPADMQAVLSFAQQQGLTVVNQDAASRRIQLQGTAAQMDAAFGVELVTVEDSAGHSFVTYQGTLSVPQQLAGIVTAVLGLSQRTVAQRR